MLGSTPPGQRITFALVLRLPGQKRMQAYLNAVEDPRSPMFHRFLAPQQFGARFGIASASLHSLEHDLRASGVRVLRTYPQRTEVDVNATVGVTESLLHVRIANFRDAAGRSYHAPTGSLTIPASMAGAVDGVTGLDNRHRFLAHDVPIGGLTPQSTGIAYDIAPLHNAGISGQRQSIALISFSGFDPSDPQQFAQRYGIAGPTPSIVPVDGGTTDTSGAVEANLDIDVIRSIAPAAQILIYEAPQSSAAYSDLINRIVADHRTTIISSSWGQCELAVDPAERAAESRALSAAVASGVSMFVASGDSGAYDCQAQDLTNHQLSTDWPAASANAIAVGGTRLYLGSNYGYAQEAGWEDQLSDAGGGGGFAAGDPRPSWQTGPGVADAYSNGHRQVPDVSGDADPGTPWAVIAGGQPHMVGGTSAATPFWAASMLLIGQYAAQRGVPRLGYVNPTLYALAASAQPFPPFHDVTRGGNRFYSAGPGWDPATGLGSPDVYNLAQAMVAYLRTRTR